jgi:filamentous hemagglutinin family protein
MEQTAKNLLLSRAVCGALRRPSRRPAFLLSASLALAASLPLTVTAAELPVPEFCVSAACTGFVSSGIATAITSGNTMTVNQGSANAVLNWRSFNISRDAIVNFVQPGSDSVALNRIYQNSASQIFGALNANGRVYLINQNGFVFGQGATVNVAGLLASSLDITPEAITDGTTNLTNAVLRGRPAFELFANGAASGDISIAQGATIKTAEGGQVLVFAPNVSNKGKIVTPGGQTALAAGSSIYLATSPATTGNDYLTGLIIEVGEGGGIVTNGNAGNAAITDPTQLAGQIVAERGNITLAGLAVNQLGRVSATTSVKQGGSIRLVAGEGTYALGSTSEVANLQRGTGGDLRLGQNSRTEVTLDASTEKSVDSTQQPQSVIQMDGNRIVLEQDAKVLAPHGNVTLTARDNRAVEPDHFDSASPSTSRIYLADGATIDVAGANIEKTMASNVISVELRGTELADSPLQRDGALRGQTVQVDIRDYGTRDDGTTWYGTPVGDVSGYVKSIAKDVSERNLVGGTVNLQSRGDVILDGGSSIDISGGSIAYQSGYVNTSRVLDANGALHDIASADPDNIYTRVVNGTTAVIQDQRWGVVRSYSGFAAVGSYEQGYVEGKDAGTLNVLGRTVVLNGDVAATTQVGQHQRKIPGSFDTTALYRPYDQLPLSGQLILGQTSGLVTGDGKDYLLSDVRFENSGAVPLGTSFDPWNTELPIYYETAILRTRLFGDDGIGRLTLRANGSVALPEDVALELPVGGSIDIKAGSIDVAGSITSHSGSIKLSSAATTTRRPLEGGLTLRSTATLDVSGVWVNDMPVANDGSAGTAALAIKGGSVTLSGEENAVTLAAGSVIDASGGAQLTAGGKFVAGASGTISLSTTPESATGIAAPLTIDGELRAFGFQNGGSLSLTTAALCVADSSAVCQEDDRDGLLRLAPTFFSQGGFSAFSLNSNQGGIEVAPGTTVRLQQNNLVAQGSLSSIKSGTSLNEFTTEGLLADIDRNAVDLSLGVAPTLAMNETFSSSAFADAASLDIGTGASIVADPSASITLTSTSRILVDGIISAPAGDISLHVTAGMNLSTDPASAAFDDQGIWLGSNARLLARGTAQLQADDLGRISGEVLNGGTISLDADRGHVLSSTNSVVDVSGTAAALDIRTDAQGRYARRTVGSAGGTIDIESAEAIVIGGDLRGESGAPGTLAAGTLRMTLDPTGRADPGQGGNVGDFNVFFPGARSIEVTQAAVPVAFGNSTLPSNYQGRALVSAEQIADGGFDAVELTARTFTTNEGTTATDHLGQIAFSGDVDLAVARHLTLNAALVTSDGGNANLSASTVTMGNSDTRMQSTGQPLAGEGTLTVKARQIDLIGATTLQGFGQATLESSGDLRLIGVNVNDSLQGSLTTAGSLTLSAAQVYPTTLTDFTITAGEQTEGTLSVTRTGSAADALSAGGHVTLRAPTIVQAGTLRAPFGTITLESPSITLAAGSITSTSGAGLTVPFGSTQGGFDWVYELSGTKTLIFGPDGASLPSQQITLDGDEVTVADGATLDVRGGGELVASEFVPGTGGTHDVLSAQSSPDSFAVLPASSLASAAYDPSIYADSGIAPGVSVYLSGNGDLPAGEYIILPARYALLPGAYLVTQMNGYQDIAAGETYARTNGSTIVSGYFTSTGTGLRDARTSGFSVLAGSEIQKQAKYTLTGADKFFAAQAESAGLSAQRLPQDAGTVAIIANTSLMLDGSLSATAGAGGRGAALDIASDAIRIVADGDQTSTEGVLSIRASDLAALGAESILIGGLRTEDAAAIDIDTRSSSVTMGSGATLTGPEVLLTAKDAVVLAQGATINASGAEGEAKDISVDGDGAFLRVATAGVVNVERTHYSENSSSLLQVDAGASLIANHGSITLESSGKTALSGSLSATDGALNLVGSLISLGDVGAAVPDGWTLSTAQLMALDVDQLVLSSRSSIDLYGSLSLTLSNLELNAAALRGSGDGGVAQISVAGDIDLRGADTTVAAGPSDAGSGQLILSADNVVFRGGDIGVTGFERVAINAQHELRAEESSSLSVESGGALDLSAQRVTTASGVDLHMTAQGAATLASAGAAASQVSTDLGGSFSLAASSIDVSGRIELPSGIVTLTSTGEIGGGVHLADGAIIDVSGRSTAFATETISSGGGSVSIGTRSGDLSIDNGALIDVSAAGNAKAGSIDLSAAAGTLTVAGSVMGNAASAVDGGSFSADAVSLTDFAALNRQLNAGGLTGERSLRQRGAGDLTVLAGADNEVHGTSVTLTADQGNIVVQGSIRAHATTGGRVLLSASDGIAINGVVDARSTGTSERNGRIDLRVGEGGGLIVADSAVIATTSANAASGSAADGTVNIRLSQDSLATVLDTDLNNDQVKLAGDWSNTAGVAVEGFKVYEDTDGVIDAVDVAADSSNAYYADAAAFGAQAAALQTALADGGIPGLSVLTGVEIRSADNLQVDADWDLSQWHFAGQPGVLTLRAAGDLTFNASLSDGFAGVSGADAFLLTSTEPSWSYHLVAGADTHSADVHATVDQSQIAGGTLTVAAGDVGSTSGYRMIRTGTGSIDVHAARDVVLGNEASMIYTAGVATDGTLFPSSRNNGNELGSGLNRPALLYPAQGGDISISAGNDVVGAASSQLVTDWLWRIGNVDGATTTRSTAWTVNVAKFHQNVGALGGGDVSVQAGRNVDTLSVSTPTIGRQTGSKTAENSRLEVIGGGNVIVSAGNDIAGGTFYSGRGRIDLGADGSVGASSQTGLNPILALGDTQASISARQDLTLETAITPTLLPQAGGSQGTTGATRSFFSTYTDASKVSLDSVAGNVSVFGGRHPDAIQSVLTTIAFGGDTATGLLQLLPPTLSMQSLRGDVNVEGSITLLPSQHGHLDIRAYNDVNLRGAVIVSDVDPTLIPSASRPSTQFLTSGSDDSYKALTSIATADIFNAEAPVRLGAATDGTLQASRIVAATGDVNGNSSNLYFGAPVEIRAGRDVTDINVIAQNLTASSVTSISAGRDISYSILRSSGGDILSNTSQITIDGPGQLTLTAGRDINLQNSVGISTRGNLVNTALGDTGASISALVGLNGQQPAYTAFAQKYLIDSAAYADALSNYLQQLTGAKPLTPESALLAFAALDESLKTPFLQQVLVAEMRASAEYAASSDPVKHGDYSRGFAALEAMFPGSNPETDGAKNPYSGDLALYFSRIYTQDGGNITLLTPGGGVNAGLATPPESFGVSKAPDQLGIVTQRGGDIGIVMDQDLLVNESRMFAIDDSDIVVWSSNGDIDAGRGSKTAISAPSPVITYDRDGHPSVIYSAALAGSGIQTRATTDEHEPGDVVLAAPRGVVNAGDAGIVAGNLTIAATAVLGADNIKVSGVAVGVPVDTGGLGAGLSGVSAAASGASSAATAGVDTGSDKKEPTPMADTALSWLDVFVVGLGEENCKQDDIDCLKRQKTEAP